MWEKCNLRHYVVLFLSQLQLYSRQWNGIFPITLYIAMLQFTRYFLNSEQGSWKYLVQLFFSSDTMLVFSQWMIWIVMCKYMIQKTSAYTQLTKSNYL